MVICASCKQYTDDHLPSCQHCGAPLIPDTLDEVRARAGLDPTVAGILSDRERARLVPSGVIAQYPQGFFYADEQRKTVLVELFGARVEPRPLAAALLFSAAVYLLREGYCALQPQGEDKPPEWEEVRPWDGQARSLEATLARQAGLGLSLRKALDQTIAAEMGFRFEVLKPPRLRAPGVPPPPQVRDLSAHTAVTALVQTARQTELPDHVESEACRQVYRLLVDFVRADPDLARYVAGLILDLLDWYRRYQEDPVVVLAREDES